MLLPCARKNRNMTTQETLHDTQGTQHSPASPSENPGSQDAAAHLPAAGQGGATPPSSADQPRSLWRRLASPFYPVGAAPWIALAVLVVQGLIATLFVTMTASLIGILLIPLAAIAFGYFERWRLRQLGFGTIANGHVNYPEGKGFDQLIFRHKETATWREVGSLLVSTLWGTLAGVLVIVELTVVSTLLVGAFYLGSGNPLYYIANLSDGFNVFSPGQYAYFGEGPAYNDAVAQQIDPSLWWVPLLGALLSLLIFAYLNGVVVAAGASLSKLILSPRPEEFERQAAKLAESRTKIVDAFEVERRRIERNLHDGVQQELVNLNLRLGLAEMEAKALAAENEGGASLHRHLVEARAQLSHAQTTLRDTVRGIYPAVLEDHGLRAALEELTRHSLLPVYLSYDAPARLPRDIERTAYYTVNEALTNTIKHAGASRLVVTVHLAADSLVVVAEDDGRGGASLERGTGLAGLTERAAALGGTVQVVSPISGTTRVTLALPITRN